MKKYILISLTLIFLLLVLCGCSTPTTTNTQETEPLEETNVSSIDNTGNNINDVLRIYEESMKENIEQYCEEYLTYQGTPIKKLDEVKSILTDEYYKQIKSTENYHSDDKDYEQATALNSLYFQDYSSPSSEVKVLAHCYQSIIVDNESNTYNTFFMFDMKYEDGKGWLINSVEKPSYEYLEE